MSSHSPKAKGGMTREKEMRKMREYACNLRLQAVWFHEHLEELGELDDEGLLFLELMRKLDGVDGGLEDELKLDTGGEKIGRKDDHEVKPGEVEVKDEEGEDTQVSISASFLDGAMQQLLSQEASQRNGGGSGQREVQIEDSESDMDVVGEETENVAVESVAAETSQDGSGMVEYRKRAEVRDTTEDTMDEGEEVGSHQEAADYDGGIHERIKSRTRRKGKQPIYDVKRLSAQLHAYDSTPGQRARKRTRTSRAISKKPEPEPDIEPELGTRKRPKPGTYALSVLFDNEADDYYEEPGQKSRLSPTKAQTPKTSRATWPAESTLTNVKMKKTIQLPLSFSNQTVRRESPGEGPSFSSRTMSSGTQDALPDGIEEETPFKRPGESGKASRCNTARR